MTKNKVRKHLQFYIDYLQRDSLPYEGLCALSQMNYLDKDIFDLFIPTKQDREQNNWEGFSNLYFGSGIPDTNWCKYKFTPLRQTIVLFMAAINDEL